MAKAKKTAKTSKTVSKKAKRTTNPKGLLKNLLNTIGGFLAKITAPLRRSKVWKFLRSTILRSPFRGYFVNSWRELKQVTWPNRKTTWKFTFTVILFSAFFAALISALDYGFDNLAQRIFLQ